MRIIRSKLHGLFTRENWNDIKEYCDINHELVNIRRESTNFLMIPKESKSFFHKQANQQSNFNHEKPTTNIFCQFIYNSIDFLNLDQINKWFRVMWRITRHKKTMTKERNKKEVFEYIWIHPKLIGYASESKFSKKTQGLVGSIKSHPLSQTNLSQPNTDNHGQS